LAGSDRLSLRRPAPVLDPTVLYEMLAGKRAFEGEDVTDTLAAVLRAEPEWSALPANTPVLVRTLLTRCLQRNQRERIGDIAAALFAIDEAEWRWLLH